MCMLRNDRVANMSMLKCFVPPHFHQLFRRDRAPCGMASSSRRSVCLLQWQRDECGALGWELARFAAEADQNEARRARPLVSGRKNRAVPNG